MSILHNVHVYIGCWDIWVNNHYIQLQEVIKIINSTIAEHVGMISATNLLSQTYRLSVFKANLSKVNLSTTSWIIPLRNNGLHCVFIQVRKLVGYFNSRVPFTLSRKLSNFINLKQGNEIHPCMAYASYHWYHKEEVPEYVDVCLCILFPASFYVPTMVHGMFKVDLH